MILLLVGSCEYNLVFILTSPIRGYTRIPLTKKFCQGFVFKLFGFAIVEHSFNLLNKIHLTLTAPNCKINNINFMNTVWLAFITGLTTGGISCFAVQGGLLASAVANQKDANAKTTSVFFLAGKLLSHILLGVVLGFLGSSLLITPKLQGYMQILAGIFMLLTFAKLLDLHPVFRKFTISPPKAFFKIVRNQKNSESIFAPFVLGFLTFLIPCGVTQAMILLAIASGNPIEAGLIMGAFTLGTSPVFLVLGITSEKLLKNTYLKYAASFVILVLAIISINTGQALRGSAHTLQNYWAVATGKVPSNKSHGQVAGRSAKGFQEVEIRVFSGGYQASVQTIKAGVPVRLKLITNNTSGCSLAFTIPAYNISKVLPRTGETIVEFTPTKKGRLVYTCSMGMYSGWFDVI